MGLYQITEKGYWYRYEKESNIASIKKGIATTARNAGIKDVSAHVFRHTAAVWLIEAGVSMSEVSQYLGHSNTNITEKVYARYSPDYLRGAASALEIGLHEVKLGSSEPIENIIRKG